MKKLLLLPLMAFLFVACSHSSKLDEALKESNAHCPMQVDAATVLTQTIHQDDNVIYCYILNEEMLGASVGEMFSEEATAVNFRKAIVNKISTLSDPEWKSFITLVQKAHCSLIYRYQGSLSGVVFEVNVPYKELKEF